MNSRAGARLRTTSITLLNLMNILKNALLRRSRTHNYTHHQEGVDYTFDHATQESGNYMTGHGKNVKPGDRILLSQDGNIIEYQVETIEYYASPSDLWIAVLTKVNLH